jgi:hypothetical protein
VSAPYSSGFAGLVPGVFPGASWNEGSYETINFGKEMKGDCLKYPIFALKGAGLPL